MQYLPIYPEKSWLETVATPTQQIAYKWDWWENLPLYYTLWSNISQHWNSSNPADKGLLAYEIPAIPVAMLTDALWTWWNTAINWYKRAYNYWANAYNNLADKYNNWQMQRHVRSPQQLEASLQTIPVEATPEKAQQIVVENNTALWREQEARIIEAKDKITKALSNLVANGWLQKNAGLAKKLIDLYNKI